MDLRILVTAIICVLYLLVLLPIYIWMDRKRESVETPGYKLVLSGIFCVLGLAAVFVHDFSIFPLLILGGLILAMIGDYFLVFLFADEKRFICGILAFSVTQVFYIAGMIVLSGIGIGEFIMTILVLSAILIVVLKMKPDFGKARLPINIYTALVTLMAAKAVMMLLAGERVMTLQWMFSMGALLFWVSDMFLGINRFIKKRRIFSTLVAVCYFLGQLMIAISVYYQQ
ncbi:lysoplasmalogenase [Parasporobacterium paucivorans]|uniref:Uncharacterized membrane protein YhhN n=1 Tax=Parasporobacterium paucivorans DSM 15970 TaxID=1122934 RepID=A0A1M6GGB7_9FIRM|nr:lysoplasmalogenase [Parasporobacterium paucivorans]SHJ08972.1 Uncharacterized membrane protein YhhN [Parasporobacterium paucivorans DSM 15970]